VEFSIAHPAGVTHFELAIDLVAENVVWFEVVGGKTARFSVRLDDGLTVERV
jgi:hypothetical protein